MAPVAHSFMGGLPLQTTSVGFATSSMRSRPSSAQLSSRFARHIRCKPSAYDIINKFYMGTAMKFRLMIVCTLFLATFIVMFQNCAGKLDQEKAAEPSES